MCNFMAEKILMVNLGPILENILHIYDLCVCEKIIPEKNVYTVFNWRIMKHEKTFHWVSIIF